MFISTYMYYRNDTSNIVIISMINIIFSKIVFIFEKSKLKRKFDSKVFRIMIWAFLSEVRAKAGQYVCEIAKGYAFSERKGLCVLGTQRVKYL